MEHLRGNLQAWRKSDCGINDDMELPKLELVSSSGRTCEVELQNSQKSGDASKRTRWCIYSCNHIFNLFYCFVFWFHFSYLFVCLVGFCFVFIYLFILFFSSAQEFLLCAYVYAGCAANILKFKIIPLPFSISFFHSLPCTCLLYPFQLIGFSVTDGTSFWMYLLRFVQTDFTEEGGLTLKVIETKQI